MTLPETTILPLPGKNQSPEQYIPSLIKELTDIYDDIADNINGETKSSLFVTDPSDPTKNERNAWTPTLKGTGAAGSYVYTNRLGWAFRQGLMTDIWFDISWTSQVGAAGNLYVELPYIVAKSTGKPFVGPLQTETLAYGAGQTVLTVNAIPNTNRAEIWSSGSGNSGANISAATAAGHLIGFVRFIGQ